MEQIAIIGAGMRLPGGVHTLDGLGEFLLNKMDAVKGIPADRWNSAKFHDPDINAPGKLRASEAALLDRHDLFDAEFFGIAPREAARLDPCHRLILECGWEAIEDAAINPHSLSGSQTGVYIAMGPSDFELDLVRDHETLDAYSATGVAYGTGVGRLSYFLDLVGPAIAIDTGCSGALTAVHMAAQALRAQECDLALAGGVNVILNPELGIIYSKAHMLSPDGRCRAFSSDASGFVRAEGCGLIVLKRLNDALACNDKILGVIRGSAINQDGRSAGLTAPRGTSQEAVITAALQSAQTDPSEITFVEAHGTGTPLGDPIEVAAIGAVLCHDRSKEEPLLIGSVKTNIGHLESAAGIAGLLKVLSCFRTGQIPANLHFAEPNPFIDWDRLPVKVPIETIAWPACAKPRVAGLSSFGFGGSNAHVILADPPPPAQKDRGRPALGYVLPLSARSPKALAELASAYANILKTQSLADVSYTASTGRAHFEWRYAAFGNDPQSIAKQLNAALPAIERSQPRRNPVCFEFHVVDTPAIEADVAHAIGENCPAFAAIWQQVLADLEGMDDTKDTVGALSLALTRAWISWGIIPYRIDVSAGSASPPVVAMLQAIKLAKPADSVANPVRMTVVLGGTSSQDAWCTIVRNIATLYNSGADINWTEFYRGCNHQIVPVPNYPFQRQRHWPENQRSFNTSPADRHAKISEMPLLEVLAATPRARQLDVVVKRLRSVLNDVRNWDGDASLDRDFKAAGLDVMSAQTRELIEVAFGSRLPPTLLLNNRNLKDLSKFLLDRFAAVGTKSNSHFKPAAQAATTDPDLRRKLLNRLAALR